MSKHIPYQLTHDTWFCSKCGKKMFEDELQEDCPTHGDRLTRICWVDDLETLRKHILDLEFFVGAHSMLRVTPEIKDAKERVFGVLG